MPKADGTAFSDEELQSVKDKLSIPQLDVLDVDELQRYESILSGVPRPQAAPVAPSEPGILSQMGEAIKGAPAEYARLPAAVAQLGPRLFSGELGPQVAKGVASGLTMGLSEKFEPSASYAMDTLLGRMSPEDTQPTNEHSFLQAVVDTQNSFRPFTPENAELMQKIAGAPVGIVKGFGKFLTAPSTMLEEDPGGFVLNAILARGLGRATSLRFHESAAGPEFTAETAPEPITPPTGPTIEKLPPAPTILGEQTVFERAFEALHHQASEGGVPGGQAVSHAVQGLLAEAQLVFPKVARKDLKARFATDREGLLRDIAFARAKAILDQQARGEDVTTRPEVPLNVPQGEFPSTRMEEIRSARAAVERYTAERFREPKRILPVTAKQIDVAPSARVPITDIGPSPSIGGDLANAVAGGRGGIVSALAASAKEATMMGPLSDVVQTVLKDVDVAKRGGFLTPQFFKLKDQSPELHGAIRRLLGAPDDALVSSMEGTRNIREILPKQEDFNFFTRFMVDEQLRAAEADPARAAEVNQAQKLTDSERQSFIDDPKMMEALQVHRQTKADFERWNADAGVKTLIQTPLDAYVKLIRAESDTPGSASVIGPNGKIGPFRKIRAKTARQRTGTGLYVADYDAMLHATYRDKLVAARHNQLNDMVRSFKTDAAEVEWPGEGIVKVLPVMVRPLLRISKEGEKPYTVPETIPVPAPVKRAYEQVLTNAPEAGVPGFNALNRIGTSLLVAGPPEAIWHTLQIAGAASTFPGVGKGILNYETMGRTISAVARAVDLSGPDATRDYQSMARNAAARTSYFKAKPRILSAKRAAFAYPGEGKGIRGMESRLRVVGYRMIRAEEPNLDEAAAWAKVDSRYGVYVNGLMPRLTKALRGFPVFDPFARAGVALGQGAVKSLLGFGPSGWDAELAASNVVGMTASVILLNKMIDPQHRWPWERAGLRWGDLRVYEDAHSVVDVPLTLWAPALGRAMAILPIREVLQDVRNGHADPSTLFSTIGIGAENVLLHRFGPGVDIPVAGLTGRTLHMTKDGLLRIADPSIKSRWEKNLKSMFYAAQPTVGGEMLMGEVGARTTDSPSANAVLRMIAPLGLRPKVGAPESEQVGAPMRMQAFNVKDETAKMALRSLRIRSEAERRAYVENWFKNELPKEPALQIMARRAYASFLIGHQKSLIRSRAQAQAAQ